MGEQCLADERDPVEKRNLEFSSDPGGRLPLCVEEAGDTKNQDIQRESYDELVGTETVAHLRLDRRNEHPCKHPQQESDTCKAGPVIAHSGSERSSQQHRLD